MGVRGEFRRDRSFNTPAEISVKHFSRSFGSMSGDHVVQQFRLSTNHGHWPLVDMPSNVDRCPRIVDNIADAISVLDHPANQRSIAAIANILESQVDPAGTLRLAAEMDRADPVRALSLLQEFHKGFLGRR